MRFPFDVATPEGRTKEDLGGLFVLAIALIAVGLWHVWFGNKNRQPAPHERRYPLRVLSGGTFRAENPVFTMIAGAFLALAGLVVVIIVVVVGLRK